MISQSKMLEYIAQVILNNRRQGSSSWWVKTAEAFANIWRLVLAGYTDKVCLNLELINW